MKQKTLLPTLIVGLLAFAGCATKPSNLVLLNTGVATASTAALMKYPQARPEVGVVAAVVCASAKGTNATPAAIRDALQGVVITDQAWAIMTTTINLFSYATANLSKPEDYQPYAQAVCDGLNFGLAMTAPAVVPPTTKALQSPKATIYPASVPMKYAPRFPQLK
jgi:hypothetical protein